MEIKDIIRFLAWTVLWILAWRLFISKLKTNDYKSIPGYNAPRAVLFWLYSIAAISMVLPVFQINNNTFSIIQLVSDGSVMFVIVALNIILPLVLILFNRKYLDIIGFVFYVSSYIFILIYYRTSFGVYHNNYLNGRLGVFWIYYEFFLPMLVILFFIFLFNKHETTDKQDKVIRR